MQILFKTIVVDGKTYVVYYRDGVEVSRQETNNPMGYMAAAVRRLYDFSVPSMN